MEKSEQINELASALSKAQGEIKDAVMDATNPFFDSKYSTLASVLGAIREPLAKNGISVIQIPGTTETGNVSLTTLLTHSSGQYVSGTFVAKPKDHSPQSFGSVITYLRRYSLQSFIGVASIDDDGNQASIPEVASGITTSATKATGMNERRRAERPTQDSNKSNSNVQDPLSDFDNFK